METRQDKRMSMFEILYADLHDLRPEDLKQYRFETRDGYSNSAMAHDYRVFCGAIKCAEELFA